MVLEHNVFKEGMQIGVDQRQYSLSEEYRIHHLLNIRLKRSTFVKGMQRVPISPEQARFCDRRGVMQGNP